MVKLHHPGNAFLPVAFKIILSRCMTASSLTRRAISLTAASAARYRNRRLKSKSMMASLFDDPRATRATASCAVRSVDIQTDQLGMSASKIGSRMSFNAPEPLDHGLREFERTRTFFPPSFGISFFRACMADTCWY